MNNQNLLELVKNAQASGPKKTVVKTAVEEFGSNATTLAVVAVPFQEQNCFFKQEARNVLKPFLATEICYTTSAFKSLARETMDELTLGVSIDVWGVECACDANNEPILDENGNYILVEDKEAEAMITFRPQWGVNYNKSTFARLKGEDMLNLVPNRGVPMVRKLIAKTDGSSQEVSNIDWSKIPGLQSAMEKPLLNAKMEGNEELLEFLSHIPTASNAPSKQLESKVAVGNASFDIAGAGKDPFATE